MPPHPLRVGRKRRPTPPLHASVSPAWYRARISLGWTPHQAARTPAKLRRSGSIVIDGDRTTIDELREYRGKRSRLIGTYALYLVAFNSGMRTGELLALTWADYGDVREVDSHGFGQGEGRSGIPSADQNWPKTGPLTDQLGCKPHGIWRSGRGSNSESARAVARCSTQLADSADSPFYSALQRSQNWVRFGSARFSQSAARGSNSRIPPT